MINELKQIRVEDDNGVTHYSTKYYSVNHNNDISTDELSMNHNNQVIATVEPVMLNGNIITYKQTARV